MPAITNAANIAAVRKTREKQRIQGFNLIHVNRERMVTTSKVKKPDIIPENLYLTGIDEYG